MDHDVVPYTPDQDAAIVRLQTHLWGDELERNAAYLKWKYTDNPYIDEPLIHLVCAGDRLIGMRGMSGTLWEAGEGARHLLPYADDFVILPEYRNRGLAGRILRDSLDDARRRGHRLAINLSAGPVTFVSSLAAGWRFAGSYRQLQYRRAPAALSRRLQALVGKPLYRRAARAAHLFAARTAFDRLDRARPPASALVTAEDRPRPQAMADLVQRLPWDGRIRHVRDERYFSWRFLNPLHEYRFLFAGQHVLRGYLVLQRQRSRWAAPQQVNIVDWEAADDDAHAALLDAALVLGRFECVRIWSTGASPTALNLLRERGFAAVEAESVRARSGGLLVRQLDDAHAPQHPRLGGRNPFAIDDWDLRMIYSMAG